MLNAILNFFSAFNPIVFGAVLAAGAVIGVRRPSRLVALRPSGPRASAEKGQWRHQP